MSPMLALDECSIPGTNPVVETKKWHPRGLVATSFVYGLAVVGLGLGATVDLIRRRTQTPSTKEVSR